MGKKYLDVKKDSLEESILDIWQTAAELEEMSAADKARKFKAMGRTKKKVTLTKSSPTGPTHATSAGGDIGGATRTGKKRPGSSQATKDYRAGYGDDTRKKQSGETMRKRKEKLQGLQKKRAALSKEREKIAADYDAEILELDNLLESDVLDEARQLKDPKKEMLVVKGGKVVAIDKKDAKEYLNKGWEVAESVEIDEAKDHVFRVTSGNKQGNVHAKDEKEAVKKAKAKGMKGDIKVTDMGVYKGQPTLEDSVLQIWQTAAEGKAYEIGTDEYREYLERLTPGETIKEKKGDKEAYQKFFNSALKKFGVKSPAELKGDKKKEFFDYVDKNWTGDHEEAFEFAKKSKIDSMKEAIAKVWSFSEKVNKDKDEDKEVSGNKTLTGKKAAVVEIDPEPDLENRKKKKSGNPDH